MKLAGKNKNRSLINFMLIVLLSSFSTILIGQTNCEITKGHGQGYSTTITSVTDNGGNSYTIVLTVEHNGCPGPSCKELSHYSIEADENTYSDVSVNIVSGSMTYSKIDMGYNLGKDPFDGFKIDGTKKIGDGDAGVFTITYTLTGGLQNQQTLVKPGKNRLIVSFSIAEFQQVLNCASIDPPIANNDATTTEFNTAVDINVLANDTEGSGTIDPTTVTFVSGTAPNPTTEGTFTVNGTTGLVTFTPVNGFSGIVTIDYEVCDDNSLCDEATITVTVNEGSDDGDDDGVPDDEDDYPENPDKAFDNYFPATGYGTLAYEDLWPGKGDYDFNDLVLDYKFQIVTNSSNKVVEIVGSFIVKAFGAGMHNGFAFQFPNDNVDQDHLTVTGYDIQENYINLNNNGLENGQSKPTIIVFDDAYNIMAHPGTGIGVNTSPSAPYIDPVTLTINIEFSSAEYTMAEVDIENFNPFIIVNLTRGKEVHLPNYVPTDLVDPSYFGTQHDDSNPATGRYYKTANNLPWAINIYESFDYPKERIEISQTYLHFINWATNNGQSYDDWYQDKSGYRNTSYIYVIE